MLSCYSTIHNKCLLSYFFFIKKYVAFNGSTAAATLICWKNILQRSMLFVADVIQTLNIFLEECSDLHNLTSQIWTAGRKRLNFKFFSLWTQMLAFSSNCSRPFKYVSKSINHRFISIRIKNQNCKYSNWSIWLIFTLLIVDYYAKR